MGMAELNCSIESSDPTLTKFSPRIDFELLYLHDKLKNQIKINSHFGEKIPYVININPDDFFSNLDKRMSLKPLNDLV